MSDSVILSALCGFLIGWYLRSAFVDLAEILEQKKESR